MLLKLLNRREKDMIWKGENWCIIIQYNLGLLSGDPYENPFKTCLFKLFDIQFTVFGK